MFSMHTWRSRKVTPSAFQNHPHWIAFLKVIEEGLFTGMIKCTLELVIHAQLHLAEKMKGVENEWLGPRIVAAGHYISITGKVSDLSAKKKLKKS